MDASTERKRVRGESAAAAPATTTAPHAAPYVLDYRPYTGGQLQALRQRQWHIPASTRRDYSAKQSSSSSSQQQQQHADERDDDDEHSSESAAVQRVSWDLYYRNNTVNGYKDRHYILREFHELRHALEDAAAAAASCCDAARQQQQQQQQHGGFAWLEAGCGVGNTLLPVLELYAHVPQWRAAYAFDVSPVAIALLQRTLCARLRQHADTHGNDTPTSSSPLLTTKGDAVCMARKLHTCALDVRTDDVTAAAFRCYPQQHHHYDCDQHDKNDDNNNDSRVVDDEGDTTTSGGASGSEAAGGRGVSRPLRVEFVTLIFVLCSIPVCEQLTVLRRLAACLTRRGGVLFFRDYAACDYAQQRFARRRHRQRRGDTADDDVTAKQQQQEQQQETATATHGTDDAQTTTTTSSSSSFARTNGTLTHFFRLDEVRELFARAGLRARELAVVQREVHNRKTHERLQRRFVQGRFCRDDDDDVCAKTKR